MENKTSINHQTTPDAKRTLGDVFSLFYGTDQMRPVMLKPFVVGIKPMQPMVIRLYTVIPTK